MKLTAEIIATETNGDTLRVTAGNVRTQKHPEWRGCGPAICFDVPLSQSPNFTVGRKAEIHIKLERKK